MHNDKRTSAEFMSVKGTVGGWIDNLADFVGLGGKESIAQGWVEESISDNPATLAMFRKLIQRATQKRPLWPTVKAISLPLTL